MEFIEKHKEFIEKHFVKIVVALLLIIAIGISFFFFAVANYTGISGWLDSPISELKIWHLLLLP